MSSPTRKKKEEERTKDVTFGDGLGGEDGSYKMYIVPDVDRTTGNVCTNYVLDDNKRWERSSKVSPSDLVMVSPGYSRRKFLA